MKSIEYQELSLRTVPPDLAYWLKGFDGDAERVRLHLMTNCALGMSGEAAEIADLPISDEIGDGYWYSYILLFILNVQGYEPQGRMPEDAGRQAFLAAGRVCELVKKHAFHGRPFDEVREGLVRATKRYIDALAAMDDQSAAETFAQNVRKLERRYPEGFFARG